MLVCLYCYVKSGKNILLWKSEGIFFEDNFFFANNKGQFMKPNVFRSTNEIKLLNLREMFFDIACRVLATEASDLQLNYIKFF